MDATKKVKKVVNRGSLSLDRNRLNGDPKSRSAPEGMAEPVVMQGDISQEGQEALAVGIIIQDLTPSLKPLWISS